MWWFKLSDRFCLVADKIFCERGGKLLAFLFSPFPPTLPPSLLSHFLASPLRSVKFDPNRSSGSTLRGEKPKEVILIPVDYKVALLTFKVRSTSTPS